MKRLPIVLFALTVAACAVRTTTEQSIVSTVHAEFAALRPAMIALRVEGAGPHAGSMREGLYRALLAKDYSVLAPGAPGGEEVGVFRVRIENRGSLWTAIGAMEDPFGTVIFEVNAKGLVCTAAELARALAEDLPRK